MSALLFPGSGHFALKRPIQGCILALISLICVYFLFTTAMDIAQGLSVKLQTGQVPLDLETISALVNQEISSEKAQSANTATFVLGFTWLAGMVDCFRIGRSKT